MIKIDSTNMVTNVIVTLLALSFILSSVNAGDINVPVSQEDKCQKFSSCSSCLSTTSCTWCVTKSKCTKQSCGNDNVIYPKHIKALMSGPQFCPRVLEKKESVFQSGHKEAFVVKITQIYLYMAFTPWKCKINLNGVVTVVNAVLLADEVYCQSAELKYETADYSVSGNVTVMWNYDKSFDGSIPFKVCRTDLDPSCSVYPA